MVKGTGCHCLVRKLTGLLIVRGGAAGARRGVYIFVCVVLIPVYIYTYITYVNAGGAGGGGGDKEGP